MASKIKSIAALVLLAIHCHATTVVVIVTPQTIFVGADGKATDPDNPKASWRVNKTTIFQDRLIVAVISMANIEVSDKQRGGKVVFRYDFAKWMAEIEKKAPLNVSVSDLTRIIENESRIAFKDMDGYIAGGAFGYDKTHKNFIEYIIAGFENGIPIVNDVHYRINWETLRLEGPILIPYFSEADRGVNFNFHIAGARATDFNELKQRKGQSYEELVAVVPKELDKVLARQNLSFDETKAFCLALLRTQAKHSKSVGPPYKITTTVPVGAGKPEVIYRGN